MKRLSKKVDDEEPAEDPTLRAATLTLEQCRGLKDIVTLVATYWEAPVLAALRVKEVFIKDGELRLRALVLGTQTESLLRRASEQAYRVMDVHLCPDDCTGGPHEDGVLHVKSFKPPGAEREAWMSNLLPEEAGRDRL